ncbi:hypothetical protein [Kitasatospora sp. NPDC051705]|uniref:hypothetical protein n=1 Tax=Kitasatospora sp. NPDC051705 TaxID=3364057 RepID=UPI00379B1B59
MDNKESVRTAVALLSAALAESGEGEVFDLGHRVLDEVPYQALPKLVAGLATTFLCLARLHDSGDQRSSQEILQWLALQFQADT